MTDFSLQRASLGFYPAWIPLAGLLVLLLYSGGLTWPEAATVAIPLCFVYAVVCRSSQYLCRILPLRRTAISRLLVTHGAAALLASGLFVGLAWRIGAAAPAGLKSAGFVSRMGKQTPALWTVGVSYYLMAVAFHYVLLALEAAQEAERRESEARVLAREAELRVLKAQVNPHFLFNSLHSISALTSVDPSRAREMCILLSDFLRSSLGLGSHASIPLREELALAKRYLAVEQVRFGDRMELREEVECGCLDCLLPPLLLQPLIENAIKHGIATLTDKGWILLKANAPGARLAITVENNFDPEAPARNRNGLGLPNVRSRLAARYGSEAELETAADGDRYRADLRLPAERETDA